MPLAAGTRLGPYEIQSLLGAGGMGEVYKAKDTRLDRTVAVKVCNEKVADRFAREARAVAALNHPNIVALFDVGENYFVTELVDGESLRTAQLPPRRVIEVAAQIADGLAAAHAVNISHRDIKPDNIMLTRDGRAKILDFGLARHSAPGPGDATQTLPGTVMGTAGYMSPEQVRGEEADHRSDIFSFGATLYEMLAGKRAFTGDTAAEVMTAILKSDPPELSVSPQLREIVRHCMEKDPTARFQSAKDLEFALRSTVNATETAVAKSKPSNLVYVLAAAGVIAAFAAGWAIKRDKPLNLDKYRFTPIASEAGIERNPAFSPDGLSIAYDAGTQGRAQIFVRRLDSPTPDQITHEDAPCSAPFWSPKGDRIYFTRGGNFGQLWSIAAVGGAAEKVLEGNNTAALAPDGVTMAVARRNELSFGKLGGKEWTPLKTAPFDQEFTVYRLRFSPDGKKLAVQYTVIGSFAGETWVVPLPPGSGAAKKLLGNDNQGRASVGFDWMPDSRNLVVSLADEDLSQLYLADSETGALRTLTASIERAEGPSVSPDGRKIAFERSMGDSDVVEFSLDGLTLQPLLETSRSERYPSWRPNGREFVYLSNANGRYEPWTRNVEDGRARPLLDKIGDQLPNLRIGELSLSPDGERLSIITNGVEHTAWALRVRGGKAIRLDAASTDHHSTAWSPDGNWIAYGRVRPKRQLMKVPSGGGSPVAVSEEPEESGASFVEWSPTGEWIAWAATDQLTLYSPDGKQKKKLANRRQFICFSPDGKLLYAFRPEPRKVLVEAFDVATGKGRDIGSVDMPAFSRLLSVASHPDGKRFIATLVKGRSDIAMLEGY